MVDSLLMWTPEAVRYLRERLGMEVPAFARITGVDPRTVYRWEAGAARPSGAAVAVLNGLKEKLDKDPSAANAVSAFLVGAAAVGGLAYLLVKLLDSLGKSDS
jgi:transcriptional regulator with XRE-family HTH domain